MMQAIEWGRSGLVSARRSSATALLVSTLLSACAREPIGPESMQEEPLLAFVSDPVSLTAGAPAAAPGVDIAYVSLPPGSVTSGSDVEVLNTANGVEELIPIIGGGFDPVPIPALPGDTLQFRVLASRLGDDLERAIVVTQWNEVVPARSPPDIVRTYPGRGKRDVPVALSMLVVFSEPLDSLSVGEGSIELLLDGSPVPASINLSPDGLRLAMAPAAPLASNTEYVLRIVASIEDLDGDPFGREEQVRFSTGTPGSQSVLAPTDLCSSHPPTSVPTFVDANLEGAIRTTLGFTPQDVLTCEVVADLTSLTYSPAPYQTSPPPPTAVQSVVGIQNLTGLTRLVLVNHALTDIGPLANLTGLDTLSLSLGGFTPPTISDIGPLAALTGLRYLNLNNARGIRDLSPLSGLTSLADLHVRWNWIEDLRPLAGLSSLRRLNLAGNAIRDVEPLRGLTGLTWLAINQNAITDIRPLSGLTNLTGTFWLMGNELTDLRPLSGMSGVEWLVAASNDFRSLDGLAGLTSLPRLTLTYNSNLRDVTALLANPNLAGDTVDLSHTSVSCEDVERLRDRGAVVYSTCLVPPVFVQTRPLADGTVGVPYLEILMATGGDGVYTWSGGPVPLGLTLSASGVISGVPTTPGYWNFTAAARSGAAFNGRTFSIVVAGP